MCCYIVKEIDNNVVVLLCRAWHDVPGRPHRGVSPGRVCALRYSGAHHGSLDVQMKTRRNQLRKCAGLQLSRAQTPMKHTVTKAGRHLHTHKQHT